MFQRIVTISAILFRFAGCDRCPALVKTMTAAASASFQYLEQVPGRSDEIRNNILVSSASHSTGSVVYFGGDVQSLSESMLAHRDNGRYVQWSLENTMMLLKSGFPEKDIIIVRPARLERGTFSCFDNFVESNWNGSPTFADDKFQALPQLKGILENLRKAQLNKDEVSFESTPIILVGFSKGVVVLNQILHELASIQRLKHSQPENLVDLSSITSKISAMVWLDGGHNGGKDTWITNQKVLQVLAHHGIRVDVRVTPYQIKDDLRPWIGREEKKFSSILSKEMPATHFRRKMYFEAEEPNIENHFRVLETFKPDDDFFIV